jgi:neutral trehalase
MLALFNKDLAMANAVEITKAITPSGFIPNYISVSGFFVGAPTSSWDRSQPPVGSAIVYNIYKKYPEKWFLTEVYDELLTWNRWWDKERVIKDYLAWGSYGLKKDGTEEKAGIAGAMWESGLDNSPMYDDVPFNETTHTLELADVGLMSMYIMDCNSLMEISRILGKKADTEELKKRADFYKKRLGTLWNEKTGIFLNKRTDTDEFSHRLSPTNFYPMLANACTPKQAERMIKEHYYNSEEFYGEYVLPSIARNDPAFADNAYWRGRIWPPMNFLVYLGMQNYDNIKEARLDLIEKSRNLLMKGWDENGSIWENFNSVNGNGWDDSSITTTHHGSDSFYHWGSLLVFMEFIEKGYMKPEGEEIKK